MFEGLTSPDNPNDASLKDTAASFNFPNTYIDATHSNSPLPHQQQDVVVQSGNIHPPPTVAPELRRSRRLEAARLVTKRNDTNVHVSSSANSLGNNASPLLSLQRKEESKSFNTQVNQETPSDIVVSFTKSNVLHSVLPRAVKSQRTRSSNTGRGVKVKCSNCGVTHTPLWRRGLNGELNCNACGLYYNLHKRPRPESMRNSRGGRVQVASLPPQRETVDVMPRCCNCQTTSTTLWRKDDKGKTICSACGLYYKVHGSARPISRKFGATPPTRKRSRARQWHVATSSPGNSRSPSLVPDRPPKQRRMSTGPASRPPSRAGSARSGGSGGRSDSP